MYGYFLQPHNFFVPSPNEAVLKHICANFKGLPNGVKFILIDHCIGELLSINKVLSKHKRIIATRNKSICHLQYMYMKNNRGSSRGFYCRYQIHVIIYTKSYLASFNATELLKKQGKFIRSYYLVACNIF